MPHSQKDFLRTVHRCFSTFTISMRINYITTVSFLTNTFVQIVPVPMQLKVHSLILMLNFMKSW